MMPRVLMFAFFWVLLSHCRTSTNSWDSTSSVEAVRKKYFISLRWVRAAELEAPHMKIFLARSATRLAGMLTELL